MRVPTFLQSLFLSMMIGFLATSSQADDAFDQAVSSMAQGSFDDVSRAITLLQESHSAEVNALLLALKEGQLYFNKKEGKVVVLKEKVSGGYRVYPVEQIHQAEPVATEVDRRDWKRIAINNRIRGELSGALAALNLKHADPEKRKQALRELLSDLTPEVILMVKKMAETETHEQVSVLIATALSIHDLTNGDKAEKRAAIAQLSDRLVPEAKQALVAFAQSAEPGLLKKEAEKALTLMAGREQFYGHLETVFFGLSLGSVLVLAAIGLAITFGVMGVINMAHGELIMIGAYTTYVVQLLMPNHIEYSLLVAVPAAFLISALVGIAIERGVIRFLYGRPLETLLATFGISLVLQQAVRSIFSPLNRSVETPAWMSGMVEINPLFSLTLNRVYILLFCMIVFAVLFLILRKTPLGLQVRAVSQNRAMARAMGVRSQWVDAMTFGLGSGIAGVAGVALSQLTNVGPNLGQAYIIDSFMVVVFGGVGNLWGTMVAGLSLGVANKVLEPWSGAVLAKILVLVFIILFIQKRPRGLFPQKGRAAEA